MKIATRCVSCGGDRLDRSPAVLMPFVAHRIFGWEPIDIKAEWGFQHILAGQAQSLCSSLLCRRCGMLFLDMRFDDEEIAALYHDYRGEAYTAERAHFEPGYGARNAILLGGNDYMAKIEAFIQPHVADHPRVLDWGGDTGINTPFRGEANLHHIYDISSRPVLAGAAAVDLATVRATDYDLIVFSNVLEHVPAPRAALAAIAAVMKLGAILYVELPYEDIMRLVPAWNERLESKHHWHEHINFFTPEALDALFHDVGLTTIDRITQPVSAGGKESHVFSIVAKRISLE